VQTRSGREGFARANIVRDGHEAYLPMCRGVRKRVEPLFPRYLFVRRTDDWSRLRTIHGVETIVRRGALPDEMRDSVLDQIRSQEDRSGLVQLDEFLLFEPGREVEVIAGAMAGKRGTFSKLSGRGRCTIMFSLLGATRPVMVPAEFLRQI
jgi:transcription antitermination factor NusG